MLPDLIDIHKGERPYNLLEIEKKSEYLKNNNSNLIKIHRAKQELCQS
jgi:hypothetical protein